MIEALVILLITLGNRVRGGYGGDKIRNIIPFYGTTVSRLSYGVLLGGSALLLGSSPVLAAVMILTTYLGHAVAPFAPFQFMQRSNDILITSLRGLILNGATAIAIMALHSLSGGLVFLAGGLLMGPAYKLGRILPVIPLFNDGTVAAHENETSEILFGLLTSVILILSMLV